MPVQAKKLSVTTDAAARKAVHTEGSHRVRPSRGSIDVPGLYLRVQSVGHGSWSLRSRIQGRDTWLGCGRFPDVGLALARERAQEMRSQIADGIDPRELKRARKRESLNQPITWEEACQKAYLHNRPRWRDEKIARLFIARLETHTFPSMGQLEIEKVTAETIAQAIRPIWGEKHETCKRLLQYTADVLAWAATAGHYNSPESTAKIIEHTKALLGPVSREAKSSKSHLALPFELVPELISAFNKTGSEPTAKLLLEWLALTGCRSGEGSLAEWSEIDFNDKVWKVPAHRMKSRRPHEVPLSRRCMALLVEARNWSDGSDLIFPGDKQGRPFSNSSIPKTMNETTSIRNLVDSVFPPQVQEDGSKKSRRIGVHWLRTAFRTWALANGKDRQLVEISLSHKIPGVEGRYVKDDDPQIFDRRRDLMEDWSQSLNVSHN